MVEIVNNTVIVSLSTVMERMALACVQKVGPELIVIKVSFVDINKYRDIIYKVISLIVKSLLHVMWR